MLEAVSEQGNAIAIVSEADHEVKISTNIPTLTSNPGNFLTHDETNLYHMLQYLSLSS